MDPEDYIFHAESYLSWGHNANVLKMQIAFTCKLMIQAGNHYLHTPTAELLCHVQKCEPNWHKT